LGASKAAPPTRQNLCAEVPDRAAGFDIDEDSRPLVAEIAEPHDLPSVNPFG
jgi:hypothetical protein